MPAPPFPTNLLLMQNLCGSPVLASASQADPVRGRAPATERAKRSGAVRRYSLVAAKPSGPPLRSSRLDRAACVSSSHKSFADAKSLREPCLLQIHMQESFADAKSLREPCLLQIHMQESPSGMASASQADPVRGRASATERAKRSGAVRRYYRFRGNGRRTRYNQICRNRLAVWRQLPKLIPAGSTPVSCSI